MFYSRNTTDDLTYEIDLINFFILSDNYKKKKKKKRKGEEEEMPPKNTEVEEAAVVAERTKKMESVWSYILREIINFLISNIIMLLILAVVVCWQTKLFGYYAVEAVNDRKRSAAMEKLPFGKVEVKITKPNEEGNRIVGGDYVTAIVTGYDEKGMQFYSSRNRQQATGPLVIAVTSGESIMGLEDGLLHMRVGETATVRVPPDMAFGTRGKRAWNIEPWAVLTLEITAIAASREKPAESNDIEIPVAQREKKVQEAQIDEPTSTTDTHELSSFLEKAGLGKFTKKLEHIGLTTIEDFRYDLLCLCMEIDQHVPEPLSLTCRRAGVVLV